MCNRWTYLLWDQEAHSLQTPSKPIKWRLRPTVDGTNYLESIEVEVFKDKIKSQVMCNKLACRWFPFATLLLLASLIGLCKQQWSPVAMFHEILQVMVGTSSLSQLVALWRPQSFPFLTVVHITVLQ